MHSAGFQHGNKTASQMLSGTGEVDCPMEVRNCPRPFLARRNELTRKSLAPGLTASAVSDEMVAVALCVELLLPFSRK